MNNPLALLAATLAITILMLSYELAAMRDRICRLEGGITTPLPFTFNSQCSTQENPTP